jgi:hypothetical protein
MSSIRYRNNTDAELMAVVEKLVAQKHTGHASLDFNGQTIAFNSPALIEEMIRELEGEIATREAKAAGKTKRRSWLFNPALPGGKGYL